MLDPYKNNPITETIYSLLLAQGFSPELAKFIVAQSAFETGNYSSPIFHENNNLFGMKEPKQRKTTAIGTNRSHAVYTSISDSVIDYRNYWDYFKMPSDFQTIDLFCEALKKKKYFESGLDHYTKGVQFYYKKYYASK